MAFIYNAEIMVIKEASASQYIRDFPYMSTVYVQQLYGNHFH